jgi:hypothetical protein
VILILILILIRLGLRGGWSKRLLILLGLDLFGRCVHVDCWLSCLLIYIRTCVVLLRDWRLILVHRLTRRTSIRSRCRPVGSHITRLINWSRCFQGLDSRFLGGINSLESKFVASIKEVLSKLIVGIRGSSDTKSLCIRPDDLVCPYRRPVRLSLYSSILIFHSWSEVRMSV